MREMIWKQWSKSEVDVVEKSANYGNKHCLAKLRLDIVNMQLKQIT